MKRLRELRNSKGLTQSQLAELIGVGRVNVGRYEKGEREPDFNTLIKIADYFDVSIDYLLERTDDPNTNTRHINLTDSGTSADIIAEVDKSAPEDEIASLQDPRFLEGIRKLMREEIARERDSRTQGNDNNN